MEPLLQYKSRYNAALTVLFLILAFGYILPMVIFNAWFLLFFLLFGIIPLAALYLTIQWAQKNLKTIKYGDGLYIFTNNGIKISTKKVKLLLPYKDIQWVNFSFEKIQRIDNIVRGGYIIESTLNKALPVEFILNRIFLRVHKLEMQLNNKEFVRIPVPLRYLQRVGEILKQKISSGGR